MIDKILVVMSLFYVLCVESSHRRHVVTRTKVRSKKSGLFVLCYRLVMSKSTVLKDSLGGGFIFIDLSVRAIFAGEAVFVTFLPVLVFIFHERKYAVLVNSRLFYGRPPGGAM